MRAHNLPHHELRASRAEGREDPFTLERPAWQQDAACRGLDTNAFFIAKEEDNMHAKIRAAKAVCLGCFVVEECLNYALENDIRFGIWGGTTEKQRRPMRKERKQQ